MQNTHKSLGRNWLKSLDERLIMQIFKIRCIIITYPLGKTDLADSLDFSSSLQIERKSLIGKHEILFYFVSVWQVMVTAKFGKIILSQEKFFPVRVFINLSPGFIRKKMSWKLVCSFP